jgi:hypothetical protein
MEKLLTIGLKNRGDGMAPEASVFFLHCTLLDVGCSPAMVKFVASLFPIS